MSAYTFPSLVTSLALVVYLVITLNVGRARVKYKIKPPIMTGEPEFERVLRVQQNTFMSALSGVPASVPFG
jgi:glutathione S-transferase